MCPGQPNGHDTAAAASAGFFDGVAFIGGFSERIGAFGEIASLIRYSSLFRLIYPSSPKSHTLLTRP